MSAKVSLNQISSCRQCDACDYEAFKSMGDNPYVRDLQERIEQLHFKFLECQNQNKILKRELLIAKKVMCQEIGGKSIDFQTLLKFGTETGWKGRQEKVILLKNKVQDLEKRINEMEGNEPPVHETPSEEFAKERLPCDRKMFWRMELERRQVYQKAEKDLSCLIEECNILRRKFDNSKARNHELNTEIHMLRGELHNLMEKNSEDTSLVKTLHNVEIQLRDTLKEKAELRRELDHSKTLNKNLFEENKTYKDERDSLSSRMATDRQLIESLNHQHEHFQDMIEWEKKINLQNKDRYKEELQRLRANHSVNSSILDQLQTIITERDSLVQKLQDAIASRYMACQPEEETKMEDTAEAPPESQEPSSDAEATPAAEEVAAEETEEAEPPPPLDPLQIEIAKYKALFQAALEESTRMTDVATVQNKRLEDMTMQVVEVRSICMQKDLERKELRDMLVKLKKQKAGSAKRKRSKNASKSSKSDDLPERNHSDELTMKIEILSDENNFFREFLHHLMEDKESDFELYKTIIDETTKLFVTAVCELRNKMKKDEPRVSVNPDNAAESTPGNT